MATTTCYHCKNSIEPGETRRPIRIGVGHPGEETRHETVHSHCSELYHLPEREMGAGTYAIVIAASHNILIPWLYQGLGYEQSWVRLPPIEMDTGRFDVESAVWAQERNNWVIYADNVETSY